MLLSHEKNKKPPRPWARRLFAASGPTALYYIRAFGDHAAHCKLHTAALKNVLTRLTVCTSYLNFICRTDIGGTIEPRRKAGGATCERGLRMGFNETLLLVTGILSCGVVFAAWKFDKERLYSVIVVFLILIATVGGKIVDFFGHETNAGNIFYASVFLATYFLIERYGRRAAMRAIWVGIIGVLVFTVLTQLAVALVGTDISTLLNTGLSVVFGYAPRVAVASMLAYAVSQSLNVYLYVYFKRYFANRRWLRANLSNAATQVLDSAIFFSIVFWGAVPSASLWDIILTGYVIKVGYMMLAALLLHFNTVEEDEGKGRSSITLNYDHKTHYQTAR